MKESFSALIWQYFSSLLLIQSVWNWHFFQLSCYVWRQWMGYQGTLQSPVHPSKVWARCHPIKTHFLALIDQSEGRKWQLDASLTFFSDPGYVLYSAIGSFFAPMMVMIFFNWRIYLVASKTTRAIRRGFTKVCR